MNLDQILKALGGSDGILSPGPRVGDVGTEIVLNVSDLDGPTDLTYADVYVEIVSSEETRKFLAEVVEDSVVRYVGKKEDRLWSCSGVHALRVLAEWADGRVFRSTDLYVLVTADNVP